MSDSTSAPLFPRPKIGYKERYAHFNAVCLVCGGGANSETGACSFACTESGKTRTSKNTVLSKWVVEEEYVGDFPYELEI